MVVTHGSGGSRDHATPYAAFLLDAGYDVLAPDARGHGESGGLATYGVREADDLQRWAAWIRRRSPGRCVYALGSSMGGAHALMAEAAAPTFCAIVSDSAYATFLEAGLDRVARPLGLGDAGRWVGRPAAYAGLGYVRLRYGVDLLDARPVAAIAQDPRAGAPHPWRRRPQHAGVSRGGAGGGPAERPMLWLVPGATHTAAWRAAPAEFPRRIVAFFRRHG